jgi:hypothetical protein
MAKGKIIKKKKKSSAGAPDMGVLGFFGLDPVTDAVRASRFDVQEEIETIISLVRDADPKVSLSALKHLRTVLKEVAAANGLFGTVQQTKSVEGEGQKVTRTLSTNTLLSNLVKENQNEKIQSGGYEILSPVEATNNRKLSGRTLSDSPGGSTAHPERGGTEGVYE